MGGVTMFKKQLVTLASSVPVLLLTSAILFVEVAYYIGPLFGRFMVEYKPDGFEERILAAAVMLGSLVSIVGVFFGAFAIAVYAVSLLQESNKTMQLTQ